MRAPTIKSLIRCIISTLHTLIREGDVIYLPTLRLTFQRNAIIILAMLFMFASKQECVHEPARAEAVYRLQESAQALTQRCALLKKTVEATFRPRTANEQDAGGRNSSAHG
jgi:hypothetical protein